MNEESHSDLFEIRLNEEGTRYIRKSVRVIRSAVLIGIFISLLRIVAGLARIFDDTLDYSSLDYWRMLYFKTFPFFTLVNVFLFLFQIYYYWKLSYYFNKAINDKNEIAFNDSFRMLYKNSIWTMILAVSSLLLSSIDFTVLMVYHYL